MTTSKKLYLLSHEKNSRTQPHFLALQSVFLRQDFCLGLRNSVPFVAQLFCTQMLLFSGLLITEKLPCEGAAINTPTPNQQNKFLAGIFV